MLYVKEFSTFLNEKMQNKEKKATYDKGCLMLQCPEEFDHIPFEIDSEDLYQAEGDKFGIEQEPHITLLYGFDKSVDEMEILDWCRKNITKPLEFKPTKVSKFENEEYDVLKWDIQAKDLSDLNSKLCDDFPYENDYPDYKAHCTIAYLKPGKADKYIKQADDNTKKYSSKRLTWSPPSGKKLLFDV